MQSNRIFATFAAIALWGCAAHAQNLVYNNGVSYSGIYLNPGADEVGDEIILGAGPREVTSFQWEYFGSGFSGDEQFRIRFYRNDGTDLGNGTFLPNSVFYDSGLQPLAAPVDPSNRATYLFDLSSTSIILPDRFTWSVQFSGVSGAEEAGPTIYNPPVTGNNFDDYWFNNAGTWQLRGSNGVPINFGAQVGVVPEPSTYALAILGGLCGFALVVRKRSRRQ
jgi:hypothetical protein